MSVVFKRLLQFCLRKIYKKLQRKFNRLFCSKLKFDNLFRTSKAWNPTHKNGFFAQLTPCLWGGPTTLIGSPLQLADFLFVQNMSRAELNGISKSPQPSYALPATIQFIPTQQNKIIFGKPQLVPRNLAANIHAKFYRHLVILGKRHQHQLASRGNLRQHGEVDV